MPLEHCTVSMSSGILPLLHGFPDVAVMILHLPAKPFSRKLSKDT